MTNNFFRKAAAGLAENGNIQEKYIELYAKAMEAVVAIAVNFGSALLISYLIGMWWHGVLLLGMFIPLRSYAGGYHSGGYVSCYFESCALLATALLTIKYFALKGSMISTLWQLFFISVAVIFILAPMADKNKPISEKEAHIFKKRTRLILGAEVIVTMILAYLQSEYMFSCIMAISLSAFALVLQRCVEYMHLPCGQEGL